MIKKNCDERYGLNLASDYGCSGLSSPTMLYYSETWFPMNRCCESLIWPNPDFLIFLKFSSSTWWHGKPTGPASPNMLTAHDLTSNKFWGALPFSSYPDRITIVLVWFDVISGTIL